MECKVPCLRRACIREGSDLRKLEIQTPWTQEEASMFGKEGLSAWELEQDAPALDKDPQLSHEEKDLLRDIIDKVRPSDTPLDAHTWELIAQQDGKLISHAKSLPRASQVYIQEWRKSRGPTTLNPMGAECFRNKAMSGIFEVVLDLATYGAEVHPRKPPVRFRENLILRCAILHWRHWGAYGPIFLRGVYSYSQTNRKTTRRRSGKQDFLPYGKKTKPATFAIRVSRSTREHARQDIIF